MYLFQFVLKTKDRGIPHQHKHHKYSRDSHQICTIQGIPSFGHYLVHNLDLLHTLRVIGEDYLRRPNHWRNRQECH